VRVPFVDVEVVKAAFAIPGNRKIVRRQGKVALKKAAEQILPSEIVYRPKGLFSAPLRAWMSRDLAPLVREVVEDGLLVRNGFLRRDALRRLVDEDRSGREDRSKHLWHVLTLEHWYRAALSAE
jgi:asparagine synthase (glutamine-hydrolysing)